MDILNLFETGITALLALGIIDSIQEQGITGPVQEMDHNSAEYLHLLVESLRLGSLRIQGIPDY